MAPLRGVWERTVLRKALLRYGAALEEEGEVRDSGVGNAHPLKTGYAYK